MNTSEKAQILYLDLSQDGRQLHNLLSRKHRYFEAINTYIGSRDITTTKHPSIGNTVLTAQHCWVETVKGEIQNYYLSWARLPPE